MKMLFGVIRGYILFMVLFLTVPGFVAATTKKPANNDRSVIITQNQAASAACRIALVIGNSNYLLSPLKNPVNDAHLMAKTLRRLGFQVEEKTDMGYVEFNEALEIFGNKLSKGGVGLFYYAGHGVQVNGSNYIIPVDAKISSEKEVRYKAIDVGFVLEKMEQSGNDTNIVILDACRDNPFARSFRSVNRGLASIDAPAGTIIAFATAPGSTAADGNSNNGVYTGELARILEMPGLKVEEVFKMVRRSVIQKTGKAQIPWESSSLTGDFWFTSLSSVTEVREQLVESTYTEPVTKNDDVLVGIWAGKDKADKSAKLVFLADGRAEFFIDGKSIRDDLPGATPDNFIITYRLSNTDPASLDFILTAKKGQETKELGSMHFSVSFLDADTLLMKSLTFVSADGKPESEPDKEAILLRRER